MTRTMTAGSAAAGQITAGGRMGAGTYTGAASGRIAARKSARNARASRNMFILCAVLMAAVFLLVGMSAYAASVQHANNVLTEQNAYLQAEIDSLNSQIVDETKVTKIEQIATDRYGMVYPTSDNCIVIDETKESTHSLAASIRSEAYK